MQNVPGAVAENIVEHHSRLNSGSNSAAALGRWEVRVIQIKRAYEPASKTDGARILVERLWPRGIKKAALSLDAWLKDVAPSTELRQWFRHDPAKWREFRKRYGRELEQNPEPWERLLRARRGRLTLVYSSHDEEHNNAVALKEFLEQKMKPWFRHKAA